MRLKRADLPTFGRPTIAINPATHSRWRATRQAAKEISCTCSKKNQKAAEDCRTPRRFAMYLNERTSEGLGVRQSSAAFLSGFLRCSQLRQRRISQTSLDCTQKRLNGKGLMQKL